MASDKGKEAVRSPHFTPIAAPMPYEGIGRALASAFPAKGKSGLPDEFMSLLDKLDRFDRKKHRNSD